MSISSLYPLINGEHMDRMKMETQNDSKSMCFAFVVDNQEAGSPYMDIYVWDHTGCFKRYVISSDFYWTKEEETQFRAIPSHLHTDGKNTWKFFCDVERTFPEIEFSRREPFVDLLAKFYYVLHFAYPQEKFFKAGFDRIARNLHYGIKDVNDEGSTLEKIIGLPVKILRMLNTQDAINHLLATEKRRVQVKELFRKYNFLYLYQDRLLSGAQIRFLSDLIDNKYTGEAGEEEAVFLYLESFQFHYNELYENYMKYLAIRKRALKYVKLPLHYSYSPEDTRMGAKELTFLEYLDPHMQCEKRFKMCLEEDKAKGIYEYEGSQYCVRLPESLEDFLDTGCKLKNCLWTYVDRMIEKRTHIVFLYNKLKRDYVIGALEIDNKGQITQAYSKQNKPLNSDIYKFLGEYMEQKGFRWEDDWDDEDDEDFQLEEWELVEYFNILDRLNEVLDE